jgi:hypothetical protein
MKVGVGTISNFTETYYFLSEYYPRKRSACKPPRL